MYIVEVVIGPYSFWRLKSSNGRTLAHSEGYHTVGNTRRTAKKVAKHLKYCEYKEVTE